MSWHADRTPPAGLSRREFPRTHVLSATARRARLAGRRIGPTVEVADCHEPVRRRGLSSVLSWRMRLRLDETVPPRHRSRYCQPGPWRLDDHDRSSISLLPGHRESALSTIRRVGRDRLREALVSSRSLMTVPNYRNRLGLRIRMFRLAADKECHLQLALSSASTRNRSWHRPAFPTNATENGAARLSPTAPRSLEAACVARCCGRAWRPRWRRSGTA